MAVSDLPRLAANPVLSDCTDGDVRLVGGPTLREGTVEICKNGAWGGVCHSSWDSADADVVCSQLGFQHTGT